MTLQQDGQEEVSVKKRAKRKTKITNITVKTEAPTQHIFSLKQI